MTIYKVSTKTNYADSWRDPDDIVIVELGYKQNLDDALLIANNYISHHFLDKNEKLRKNDKGNYWATDFRSYGTTIYVDCINFD